MSGHDGSSDGMDGEAKEHRPAFMARLREAEENARRRPAPWDQVLIEQGKLRDELREVEERLRSIDEAIKRLAGGRPPIGRF